MVQRLKALELHGYKTFASRTIFEFPGDITAIVGPNGSGKSNISDAMRWVLGEQSYSLLRGRKTEDMIYSGSEQRPRAGMASAAIVFDNSDNWLPIDYSEVSISRRAYRDGQNEYLLNGQKVRLKEIVELLAQSGLSERTYTVIGQGLVDAALSLKPEERRKFFEEAAGIGLYRSRRDEAINRLETTKRNLERVQDILGELAPRLNSLEKQARKAQEYERIKADLKLLLREWYGYHWHQTQNELTHTHEIVKAQELRLGQTKHKLQEVESGLNHLRQLMSDLRIELNSLHGESSGLHLEREQISKNLAVLEERSRAISAQQINSKEDFLRLEEEQVLAQDRLATLEKEKEALELDLSEADTQYRKAIVEFQTHQREKDGVEEDQKRAQSELIKLEETRIRIQAHISELIERKEATLRSLKIIGQRRSTDREELEKAKEKINLVETRNIEVEEERKLVEEKIAAKRSKLEELNQSLSHLIDRQRLLQAQESKTKAQLEVLEQAEKSFGGLNRGARALLDAQQKGNLAVKLRSLSEMMIVPEEFELAIAAALGECLDAVVVKTEAELEPALVILGKGENGRAVLLIEESVQENKKLHFSTKEGILGLASELVEIPKELQGLVKMVLGQTVVVRDRETARRLKKDNLGDMRIATLKGEMFIGNSMVIAGQDGKAGVVARPRQKNELQAALVETERALDDIAGKIKSNKEAVDTVLEESKVLEKQKEGISGEFNNSLQEQQRATLQLEQIMQRIIWQGEEDNNLNQQLGLVDKEIVLEKEKLENLEGDIAGRNQSLKEIKKTSASIQLDEYKSQTVHWSTALAVTQRAITELNRLLEDQKQRLLSGADQSQKLNERIKNDEQVLTGIDIEKNQLLGREADLKLRIEDLFEKIKPAEGKLENLEREIAEKQKDQVSAQQAYSLTERFYNQAQLDYSRHKDLMDSLRRRIEDDFGLVSLEYHPDIAGQTPLPFDDGMVQQLPVVVQIRPEIEDNINRQRSQLRRMGAVNFEAQQEYREVYERHQFLTEQVADLGKADSDLREVITELDELMKREFLKTFNTVASEFRGMFTRLFGGGSARLLLSDEENLNETGIDIEARLPGRREQGLSLLSGGERSLTAVALVFSLLKTSPTPFCILDEVDAMLDEANVGRFRELLKELSEKTQFVIITHNRGTVQAADIIYGVTMGRDSSSQVISLKMDEVGEDMVG